MTVAIMQHEKRRFIPKVDFITTPATCRARAHGRRQGCREQRPINVVSTLALMDYDRDTCRMRLVATHPGVTVEEVVANTGRVAYRRPRRRERATQRSRVALAAEEIDPERLCT